MTNDDDETMKGATALGTALVIIIWAIRMEITALK
jgi:hypothetical protein